ncbi:MAG: family 20 glycosylhydrolase [Bacteroidota bacterium]|nr:family 20 glycosylhydrolase [Bacteroidota bacterium]
MHKLTLLFCALLICEMSLGQNNSGAPLAVRGFCISAPKPAKLDSFIAFINDELAPRHVNTLILRVDFNYRYESHPELRDTLSLSKDDVKKIVEVCRKNDIKIIPQINLLGHQSWAGKVNNLLKKYPEFDETPWVEMPQTYSWPNNDSLYCKSYCPLHPDVHKVVFALMDELCDVFETDAFHAGMDEVFYIGMDKCPRCSGKDKAELYAGEVTAIRNHLADQNRKLWIWGDRLIDGKTTGIGIWEASGNGTSRAIDLIPKDVVICDWHYERAEQTPVYFAMKGLSVVTCTWQKPAVAKMQYEDILKFKERSSWDMGQRFLGMMQTVWTDAGTFIDGFNAQKTSGIIDENTPWNCFMVLFDQINGQTETKP